MINNEKKIKYTKETIWEKIILKLILSYKDFKTAKEKNLF